MKQQGKIDLNLNQGYQDAFKRGLIKKYSLNPAKNQGWADRIRKSFQAGLKKKYPEKDSKDALIDKLRNNLLSGLAERYPEKKDSLI